MSITNDIQQLYIGYLGRAAEQDGLAYWVSKVENDGWSVETVALSFADQPEYDAIYGVNPARSQLAAQIYLQLFARTFDAEGLEYWVNGGGSTVPDNLLVQAFLNGASAPDQLVVANKVSVANYYTVELGDAASYDAGDAHVCIANVTGDEATVNSAQDLIDAGFPESFMLTPEMAAGADVMHLTGDMNVRIDLTHNDNQVTGLDLNGDGIISMDGVENNNPTTLDDGHDFEIVDAASRDQLNQFDITNNFRGDISFDGTGFAGDGVNTDGNIFLGGLGVDRASGGIGNDFMSGGGVAADRFQDEVISGGQVVLLDTTTGKAAVTTEDYLFGGRNADFFFASLSALDFTDGKTLDIDGGETADDDYAGMGDSAQDTDWLLIEGSDDDEPVVIRLEEKNVTGSITTAFMEDRSGKIDTGDANDGIDITNLENVDASGNLYGFLDDIDAALGERQGINTNSINYGIGSSAQLQVYGNSAINRIVGGYDNDYIDGAAGNDILLGGNLQFFMETLDNGGVINPNLAGIVYDGVDQILGGAGNDSILLELDSGIVDGGEGADTVFLTNYSIGRPEATESDSLEASLADGIIRLDLGYATHRGYRGDTLGENPIDPEANDTSTSNWVAGTADQTNYAGGKSATTVTGIESVIATGLGQIDYVASSTANLTDPVAGDTPNFTNQQNFFATTADLELRGTDGVSVTATVAVNGTDGLSAAEIETLYAQYIAVGGGAGEQTPLNLVEFTAHLKAGGLEIETAGTNVTTVTYSGGANTLYASSGDDIIEGRSGNDLLSGGVGNDDFVFQLSNSQNSISREQVKKDAFPVSGSIELDYGDGVDVIHRQTDAENNQTGAAGADNIWDGTFERDFATDESQTVGASVLEISITKAGGNAAGDELNDVVNYVSEITTGVMVNGAFQTITLDTAAIQAATTYQGLTDAINSALDATAYGTDLQATLQADGTTIFITDTLGRELADTIAEVPGAGVIVNQKANTQTANVFQYGEPEITVSQDRLIYKAYEDRAMNEGVDDDAVLGSTISLGADSYAEDLVVDFSVDVETGMVQTRIAEDQSYVLQFADLKPEDTVKIEINGVTYELQVGKALNGTLIPGEKDNATANNDFVARMASYINNFMDDDTSAGAVDAAAAGNTLTLIQRAYNGEETVFMKTPVVTLTNLSGGQVPVVTVTNTSSHEVHLLDFDGTDGALNVDNVLFVGEEFVNRAVLQTAKDAGGALVGSEAMVIDGGADDLAGYTVNLATDLHTDKSNTPVNFSVHGDDFLLTGNGNDQVTAGTGDDRVEGSLGTDTIDGGKNYYAVKVLGEAESRVVVMNAWEAASPAARVATLAGLTISATVLIPQTEDGLVLENGYFDDTLVFQQSDFNAGVTDFTIKLDGFTAVTPTATVRTVEFRNDGAGHVETDLLGNDVIGTNVTTFSNFENIRTVSGINRAVAGNGQGNDTLDISALSNATFGVSYDLTGDSTAGDVRFTTDDDTTNPTGVTAADDSPIAGDYTDDPGSQYVMKVDGVENVIGGTGDDLLLIDETEAAKDNSFKAGLGSDRIVYLNEYGDALDGESEPTVTITVNTAADTDTVSMTEGALGLVIATDTLVNVERIALEGDTAEGIREDDVLDVTRMTAGAVVDYNNGEVRTGQAAGSGVQVVIEGIVEIENVWADGNDTVIVADAFKMNDNARSDENQIPKTDPQVIQLATYLDYDAHSIVGTKDLRTSFADQVADDEAVYVINQNQFTFDMSRVGTESDVDTIDYSHENGMITAVMNFAANDDNKYVLVGTGSSDTSGGLTADGDRIDHLISVEQIVAANGPNSTIDLTNSDRDVNVTFSYNMPEAKNLFVEGVNKVTALDRQINTVRVADANDQAALGNVDLLEYRDLGDIANSVQTDQVKAVWENVQGSDHREYVQLTQWEDGTNHTFNLRGGQNEVNYNERTNGIQLNIISVNTTEPTSGIGNQFNLNVDYLNGVGVDTAFGDQIYGFNAANTFNETATTPRTDSMRIEASQGDRDLINVVGVGTSGVFLLGEVETSGSAVVTAKFGGAATDQGLVMSGFEYLWDAGVNDVYEVSNLANFASKLTLIDFAQTFTPGVPNPPLTGVLHSLDRDTIKLDNGAFGTVTVRPPVSHTLTVDKNLHMGDLTANDLQWLGVNNTTDRAAIADDIEGNNNSEGFDFQVLDITSVNASTLVGQITASGSTLGTADELVAGGLNMFQLAGTAITNFDILSLSGAGASYKLNLDDFQLQNASGTKLVGFDADLETLNLGKVDPSGIGIVTSGATVQVIDGTPGTGAHVIGTGFNDFITGGAGDDFITGGAGVDTLSGGIASEVRTIQFSGIAANDVDAPLVTMTMGTAGLVLTLNESLAPLDVDATDGDLDILAGAGSEAVAQAMATLVNANLTNINAVADAFEDAAGNDIDLQGVIVSGDKLTFTFAAGADVVTGDHIVATSADATLLVSTDTTITDGGDGGADTFIYSVATDSIVTAYDVVTVTAGDIFDFGTALDAVEATSVANGSALSDLLLQLNSTFVANDDLVANREAMIITFNGGEQFLAADIDNSQTITAADTVIQLMGVVSGLNLSLGDAVIA